MSSNCAKRSARLLAVLAVLNFLQCAEAGLQRPHVLLVVADDYGWNDIGYHQNEISSANPENYTTTNVKIETPTLDRLASEGIKLENYYVQPLCSPTRGTLLTGRYPSHTGIGPDVIKPTHPYGMPREEVFISEKFRESGYVTHAVGKWHLGFCVEEMTPTFRGFDSFTGYLLGAEDYYQHTRTDSGFEALDLRNSTSLVSSARVFPPACRSQNGTYSTSLFSSTVQRIVDHHTSTYGTSGKPLFIYLPFQSVHGPLEAPAFYVNKYPASLAKSRRTYAGMVSALDAAVAQVELSFKNAGLWDDTLLVFTTDNGGPLGSANNFPLRGHKATAWEGGVRGIAFVRGTNNANLAPLRAGGTTTELMHSTDWFVTLASVAGYGLNGTQPLDGHDQWGVFSEGRPTTRTSVVHNCPAPDGTTRAGAMRVGRFKILFIGRSMQVAAHVPQTPPPGFIPPSGAVCAPPKAVQGVWLFDVVADPRECTNLAGSRPDKVKELTAAFDAYRATTVPDLAIAHGVADPASNPQLRPDKAWGPFVNTSRCAF